MGKNCFLPSISRILKFRENINIKFKIFEMGKNESKSTSKFLKKKLEGYQYGTKMGKNDFLPSISRILKFRENITIKIQIFEMGKN